MSKKLDGFRSSTVWCTVGRGELVSASNGGIALKLVCGVVLALLSQAKDDVGDIDIGSWRELGLIELAVACLE